MTVAPILFEPPSPVALAGRRARQDLVQAAFRRKSARGVLWTPTARAQFEDSAEAGDPGALIAFVRDLFDDTADAAMLEAGRGPEPRTVREGP